MRVNRGREVEKGRGSERWRSRDLGKLRGEVIGEVEQI